MMSDTKRYSIVVELENASTICWDAVSRTLEVLAEQMADLREADPALSAEVFCVHAGSDDDSRTLLAGIVERVPQLDSLAVLKCVAVPEGRYYELKNAGIAQSTGEIVVLLDSDLMPERNWLAALLRPFDDNGTIATGGHTYLGHECFISRTLALTWIFPLREHDARQANRRPLYSNNCAFRGEWLRKHPYPNDEGFKVACTRHAQVLRQAGGKVVRVTAYGRHAALRGLRFLAWRAMVTGRDADRKVVALRTKARWRRLLHALSYGLKAQTRVFRRVMVHHRKVDMPSWQAPAAIALGSLFYGLASCAQLARVTGVAPGGVEHIPDYAEAH